jgi:hypothetical protein
MQTMHVSKTLHLYIHFPECQNACIQYMFVYIHVYTHSHTCACMNSHDAHVCLTTILNAILAVRAHYTPIEAVRLIHVCICIHTYMHTHTHPHIYGSSAVAHMYFWTLFWLSVLVVEPLGLWDWSDTIIGSNIWPVLWPMFWPADGGRFGGRRRDGFGLCMYGCVYVCLYVRYWARGAGMVWTMYPLLRFESFYWSN